MIRVRILHLEDNQLDRELVSEMLAANGIECEMVYAEDRNTFGTALKDQEIDLIISDYSLPGYDGASALELARQVREDVPFIFFSGTLGEEAAVESLKNGATDYSLKQRPERLVAAVRRALKDAMARFARERMEEELRQRDSLLRNIMENVEDLVAVVDPDGRLMITSPFASPPFRQSFTGGGHRFSRARSARRSCQRRGGSAARDRRPVKRARAISAAPTRCKREHARRAGEFYV